MLLCQGVLVGSLLLGLGTGAAVVIGGFYGGLHIQLGTGVLR